jgi:hypothetical protein
MDRVQLVKWETAAKGGQATDEEDIPAEIEPEEDAIEVAGVFLQRAGARDSQVLVSRDALDNLTFRDVAIPAAKTLADLISRLTEAGHDALDDLVHDLAETCDVVVTRLAGKVISVLARTPGATPKKIRETVVTRTAGKIAQIDVVQYNAAELEVQRLTGVVTRSAGKVSQIAWTETGS